VGAIIGIIRAKEQRAKMSKEIQLSRDLVAIVDDDDYLRLSVFKWHALLAGRAFYAACKENKTHKLILMHRLVLYAPRGMEVDHVNGNSLDNRRENLRLASHAQNGMNQKIRHDSKSGFKGVSFNKPRGRWLAHIKFRGKKYNLGYFETPELAAKEYDRAARLAFGKFARTNFPHGFVKQNLRWAD
jgi:hypothetical protein